MIVKEYETLMIHSVSILEFALDVSEPASMIPGRGMCSMRARPRGTSGPGSQHLGGKKHANYSVLVVNVDRHSESRMTSCD